MNKYNNGKIQDSEEPEEEKLYIGNPYYYSCKWVIRSILQFIEHIEIKNEMLLREEK